MKIAIIIVRTLMGLLLLFASITFLFKLAPQPELTGNTKVFMDGMNASGYLLPLVKITEMLCGLAFLTGYFVPLASILIAPITVNIFLFHVFVDLAGLPVAIFLVLANAFLAYVHWEKFKPLFAIR
jgi:putative oxidoreductase